MEGLLQPTHLFLILLIALFVAAPVIIPIRIARFRRERCTWPLAKAKRRLWIGIVLIVVGLIGAPLTNAPFTSPLGILCWLVYMVGIY